MPGTIGRPTSLAANRSTRIPSCCRDARRTARSAAEKAHSEGIQNDTRLLISCGQWPEDRKWLTPLRTATVHRNSKKNVSQKFLEAGQNIGIKQVGEHIWLVSFMDYDLGYFDHETCRLEPLANPFGPKVLPMSPE